LLRRGTEPARGSWTFPGGYVDRAEPVPEAAARETFEEVRLQVVITSLLGVYSAAGNPVVMVVYRGTIRAGQPQTGPEALEVRWFAAAEIPWDELAFPSTAAALGDWSAA